VVSGGHKGRCYVVDWLGMYSIMCLWIEKSAVWFEESRPLDINCVMCMYVLCCAVCQWYPYRSSMLSVHGNIVSLSEAWAHVYITTDIRI